VANPYNSTNPVTIYPINYQVSLKTNYQYRYGANLVLNNIITDSGIVPLQQIIQKNAFYSFNEVINGVLIPESNATTVYFYRSETSYIYNRSYEKLLDAISYIGGIFQSILALFFFVQLFNASYF